MWQAPFYQQTPCDAMLAMMTDSTGSGSKSPPTSNENGSLEQSPVLSFSDNFVDALHAYNPAPQCASASAQQAQAAWIEPPKVVVRNAPVVWQTELAQAGLMANTTSTSVKCIPPALTYTPNLQSQTSVEQMVGFNHGASQTVGHYPVAVGAQRPEPFGMQFSDQYLFDLFDESAWLPYANQPCANQQYPGPPVLPSTVPQVQYVNNNFLNVPVCSQFAQQQQTPQLPNFQGTFLADQTPNNVSDASEFMQYVNQLPSSDPAGPAQQNYAPQQQQQPVGSTAYLAPSIDAPLPSNPITLIPPEIRINDQVMEDHQSYMSRSGDSTLSYESGTGSSESSSSMLSESSGSSGQTSPIVTVDPQPQSHPPPPPQATQAVAHALISAAVAPRPATQGPASASRSTRPRHNAAGRSRRRVSMTKKAVIKELKADFGVPSYILEGRRYQANMSREHLQMNKVERWDQGQKFFPDMEPIAEGDADYLRDLLQRFRDRRVRLENEARITGVSVPHKRIDKVLLELDVSLTERQIAEIESDERERSGRLERELERQRRPRQPRGRRARRTASGTAGEGPSLL